MDLETTIQYFKGLFPKVSESDINDLLEITKVLFIPKGDFFIRAGDYKPVVGIVVSGIIRGYYITEGGQEMTPFFWEENLTTGSWETLFLKEPSKLEFEAIEDTVIATIDFIELKKLTKRNLTIQQIYIDMVEIILTNSLIHAQTYLNEKPEQRYAYFLKNSPHLADRISQKHLASHLGITPISFSRMKRRISDIQN